MVLVVPAMQSSYNSHYACLYGCTQPLVNNCRMYMSSKHRALFGILLANGYRTWTVYMESMLPYEGLRARVV